MRYLSLLSYVFLTLLFFACGNDTTSTDAAEATKETMETPAEEPTSGITLVPMPATQDFPDAAITDWTYKDGVFNYGVTGYEFAAPTPDADALMCANSGKGQHAHLIIDNEPYLAKYTSKFEEKIDDGDHYILTFLSRSYHEAIKTDAAHRAVKAVIKEGSFVSEPKAIGSPMLFYSRPKGTYVGKANTENIMLDFYPINAPLGEEYQVKAVVNGTDEFMIDEWKPYFLKGLPMGENKVELTLMKDGMAVKAPLNPVMRTFKLAEDPAGE